MAKIETIRFGSELPELSYYEKLDWHLNETRIVEFFPDKYYEVSLISTAGDSNILNDYLSKIDSKLPIAIDLEWEDELCLFQFCLDKTVVIIRHPKGEANKFLFNFLKSHFFYGKGINHDLIKLYEKFNYDFKDNIEDIARTRLEPYGHSINFVQMTLQFAGQPTAEFKDVRITKSNWDIPELSMRQVFYAAFDVVAISVAYPNFPPPMEISHQKKKAKARKRNRQDSQNDNENDPSSAEKDTRRRKKKMIKEKFETSERILWHNRIVLKQSSAQKTHCYLVSNYEGPSDCVTLKKVLFGSFPKKDIDHIGCACIGQNKKFILISLFVDHPELLQPNNMFENSGSVKIEKLVAVNPEDCTDNDVLFVQSIPEELRSEEALSLFFYAFGFDIRFTIHPNFVRIQPHRAQQSLIVKTFFPFITGEKIHVFPDFLPVVRAFIPPQFNEKRIRDLFVSSMSNTTNVKVTLLRRKTENSEQNALVTFQSVDEANEAVEKVNYKKVGDFTCYAQRYTDENHIRFLRFFELTVTNDIDYGNENRNESKDHEITTNYEIDVRKRYEKYGTIFQCKYDKNFNVYRVQFIYKNDALEALKNEKNASYPPTGTMAFVRNLPFTITDEEVLNLISPYGKVIEFVYREIDEFMRTLVVEVMYTSVEEAHAIKKALHQKQIYGEELEINVVNTMETEAPIWKMQQRRLYIKLNALSKPTKEEEKSDENQPENANKDENHNENEGEKHNENKIEDKNHNENIIEDEKHHENKDENHNENEDENHNENKIEDEKHHENKDENHNENKIGDEKHHENEDENHNENKIGDENYDENEDHDENEDESCHGNENHNENEASFDASPSNENDDEENALYSRDVDHIYYIKNYLSSESSNDDNNKSDKGKSAINDESFEVTAVGPFELLEYLSRFGHVVDIRDDFAMFLSFAEAANAQSHVEGSVAITTNDLVQEIFPSDFSVINVEYLKKPFKQSQPMAVVVDPLPDGLTEEILNQYLEGVEGYFIMIDQISSENQSKQKVSQIKQSDSNDLIENSASVNKENEYSDSDDSTEDYDSSNQIQIQNSKSIENINDKNVDDKKHLRAIVYAKSKRAMNVVHSKLHNQSFNGELLNLSKYTWHHVPQRPKNFHPFADLNPPRKQPIIVDPIPLGTKAIDVRKACEGCGKFDVKVEGSAEKPGMCRAVVQPRNMKAKVNCLVSLENAFGKAKRYPRDEVPPVLQENLEEESDYE